MSATQKMAAMKSLGNTGGGMIPGLGGMGGFRAKGSSFTPGVKSKFKKRK